MISKSWVSVQEPCTCCVQLYGNAPGGSANHQPLLNHNTTQHNTPAHSHTVFSNYSMCYISLELCSQNKHHHCAQTPFMGTIQAFGLKRDTAELHRRNVVEMKWICGLFFVYIENIVWNALQCSTARALVLEQCTLQHYSLRSSLSPLFVSSIPVPGF